MIVFCEECGAQHAISPGELDNDARNLSCRICGDSITIPKAIRAAGNSMSNKLSHLDEHQPRCEMSFHKLLIVDDSRLMRKVLRDILDTVESIQVVAEASNGREALEMLPRFKPDVITLDVQMPHMDGLTTLKHIMIKNPVPTVMLSSFTREGAIETFDALKYGAVDFMLKPSKSQDADLQEQQQEIVRKISLAAEVKTDSLCYLRAPRKPTTQVPHRKLPCNYLFAVGSSEGGYGAILKIVPRLRGDLPGALLVVLYAAPQHIHAFVHYLDHNSFLNVKRAANGELLEGGTCYVASGDEYVTVNPKGDRHVMHVEHAPFPTRRGSINMLMFSLAEAVGDHAVGIILSGAGDDGVEGVKEIMRSGGDVMVQAPAKCFCKEMPLATIKNCRIDRILTEHQMVRHINAFYK